MADRCRFLGAVADPLEQWREVFQGGELVADGVQLDLWLGDVDLTGPATLAEVEARAHEAADAAERRGTL